MDRLVYSGTFDPFTNGHLDIALRAAKLCSELIILVLNNADKKSLFSFPERLDMIREIVAEQDNIRVDSWPGLLVDYCEKNKVTAIVRGLRSESDFHYERIMAVNNQKMLPECETIFMTASPEYLYISSTMVRTVASFGGNIDHLVPARIASIVADKMKEC